MWCVCVYVCVCVGECLFYIRMSFICTGVENNSIRTKVDVHYRKVSFIKRCPLRASEGFWLESFCVHCMCTLCPFLGCLGNPKNHSQHVCTHRHTHTDTHTHARTYARTHTHTHAHTHTHTHAHTHAHTCMHTHARNHYGLL